MSRANCDNPGAGRRFQSIAARILENHFGNEFQIEQAISIGYPPKAHKFDLVTRDLKYVGECKCYSWTDGGNVPSAKMGFVNEALFYLSFLPGKTIKFIAFNRDIHNKNKQTLAEYYIKTYYHLVGDVKILEIDVRNKTVREVR